MRGQALAATASEREMAHTALSILLASIIISGPAQHGVVGSRDRCTFASARKLWSAAGLKGAGAGGRDFTCLANSSGR